MVKVQLKDGTIVEVPQGRGASFNFKMDSQTTTTTTLVGATLDVRDTESPYEGRVVASFLREEVVGYRIEPEAPV